MCWGRIERRPFSSRSSQAKIEEDVVKLGWHELEKEVKEPGLIDAARPFFLSIGGGGLKAIFIA